MSHRFKRPKVYLNHGSMYARLHKRSELIENQQQLDNILASVPPDIGQAWLKIMGPHLKFVPRQFAEMEPCP